MEPNVKKIGEQFVGFLNKAVSPFHAQEKYSTYLQDFSAVEECTKLLKDAGFKELKESDRWDIKPENKYFVTRNRSCVMAFAVGGRFQPGNGVSMIAAHTDSPCLKVKPVSKLTSGGCLQVGVSTYGGGLWRTWFDRDLTLAGRLIVKNENSLEHRLLDVKRPILYIPSLAIHLDTERDKFVFNKEDHLRPILATQTMNKLNFPADESDKKEQENKLDHHSSLLNLLVKECNLDGPEKIMDFDLNVLDAQPATLTGLYEEFVSGSRLDNLIGTFTAITSLIQSCSDADSLKSDPNIRLAACYDNEECGSQSAQGAATSLTVWTLKRLNSGGSETAFEESVAKSYLISADQAHAVHPNYKGKHEENHQPGFHEGPVIKINHNQRYATTALTHSILQLVAAEAKVKLQKVVVRNDSLCGTTVGPILAAKLGMQTVDVGTPQLGMHSIRELADISGIYDAQQLYKKFYQVFPHIQTSLAV